MAFRRFGTFKTPHGWLGIDGDGNVFQRGLKKGNTGTASDVPQKPFQAYLDDEKIKVTAGTIGNKVPTIGGVSLSVSSAGFAIPADGSYTIWAVCPAVNFGNVSFPSGIPTLELSNSYLQDTDTAGHLAISLVNVTTTDGIQSVEISNLVAGSLWGERVKTSYSPANYYFTAI